LKNPQNLSKLPGVASPQGNATILCSFYLVPYEVDAVGNIRTSIEDMHKVRGNIYSKQLDK
jgi:hypothetical protein